MHAIEVSAVTHRYGKTTALSDVSFGVPEGSLYAIVGPNGSGKSTLLQILTGLRRASAGHTRVLGVESGKLTVADRESLCYMAEGEDVPRWMTLAQLEAYLSPLYSKWDRALADTLRERFGLDPSRRLRAMSRGERAKAQLLCALAPRPRVLILDEPFSGMDALVKDELVRGLLELAGSEGWTALIASHDLTELESVADGLAFLEKGRLLLAEPMDTLRERYKRIDVLLPAGTSTAVRALPEWLGFEQSGQHFSYIVSTPQGADPLADVSQLVPMARADAQPVSLRELFIALAQREHSSRSNRVVAA